MNYNEMTAAHCADWLAEKDGWVKTLAKGADESDGDDGYFWAKGGKWQWEHPMLLTLDAAAGALREPWRLVSIQLNSVGWAFVKAYNDKACKWLELQGPDRLTAEYRAAVAARMEDEQ